MLTVAAADVFAWIGLAATVPANLTRGASVSVAVVFTTSAFVTNEVLGAGVGAGVGVACAVAAILRAAGASHVVACIIDACSGRDIAPSSNRAGFARAGVGHTLAVEADFVGLAGDARARVFLAFSVGTFLSGGACD